MLVSDDNERREKEMIVEESEIATSSAGKDSGAWLCGGFGRLELNNERRGFFFFSCIIHQTMFIQTTSQLPSVQNDVLTGQYAGLHLYSCM